MLAWEWTLEKARDGEGEVEKKAATRKISQTAQVRERRHSPLSAGWFLNKVTTHFADLRATNRTIVPYHLRPYCFVNCSISGVELIKAHVILSALRPLMIPVMATALSR